MTYARLMKILVGKTDEQLLQTVTIQIGEEFYEAKLVEAGDANDVLGAGHLFLQACGESYDREVRCENS